MTIQEAMEARHSVRSYQNTPIPQDVREQLDSFALDCSNKGNVHIFIAYDDPEGFNSGLARYGSFKNVNNYIVLAGKKDAGFEERCGYWGEKLVLFAQQLGLNTCWTALTFNKSRVKKLLGNQESLCMVIALGYGETQGTPHKGKSFSDVCDAVNPPEWFIRGVHAALLAPTAVNQQKFRFSLDGEKAVVKVSGLGVHTKTDLGIVRCHFEAGSGHEAVTA